MGLHQVQGLGPGLECGWRAMCLPGMLEALGSSLELKSVLADGLA